MSFPLNPNDGDLYSSPNGVIYRYSISDDRWDITFAEIQGMTGVQGNTGVQGIEGQTGPLGGPQGVTGLISNAERYFYADQLDAPNSAAWPVTGIAPIGKDPDNLDISVRLFDDTLEEGAGFLLDTPVNTSTLSVYLRSKAISSPTGASKVSVGLYTRRFPDNSTGTNWTSKYQMTDIDIPTNKNYQYDSQSMSYASLGLTGGSMSRFELIRDATNVNDTLVGDWGLAFIKITMS